MRATPHFAGADLPRETSLANCPNDDNTKNQGRIAAPLVGTIPAGLRRGAYDDMERSSHGFCAIRFESFRDDDGGIGRGSTGFEKSLCGFDRCDIVCHALSFRFDNSRL